MKKPPQRRERCLFIVWKGYQRRVEVLAPLFDAEVKFIPHLFRNKRLRPLDYFYKLVVTVFHIVRTRPDYALVQAPPHYAALPAILCRLPYILDAHNGVFQSYWHKLPLFSLAMKKARAVLVHNAEVLDLFHKDYPEKPFFVVSDPLQRIDVAGAVREKNKILFICSFDPDEPVETIAEVIERVPDFTFVITADLHKLPAALRQRIEALPNVRLTGFLRTEDYHRMLCSSTAAIALTNMVATQQSGACEALSSNTPLIATRSTLSQKLFGDWAALVENTPEAIVAGIRSLNNEPLHLESHRTAWNQRVRAGVVAVLREAMHISAGTPEADLQERPLPS
jgi:glycosyltransferase involved in cell wall biosynthesis